MATSDRRHLEAASGEGFFTDSHSALLGAFARTHHLLNNSGTSAPSSRSAKAFYALRSTLARCNLNKYFQVYMQCILGIDFSCQPCEFTLSQVDGSTVEVLGRVTAHLPLFADRSTLRMVDVRAILSNKGQVTDTAADSSGSALSLDEQASQIAATIDEIRRSLQSFQPVWTSSAVILPQSEHLSLNLDLPFSDPKNLDRIIDLEVQDVVPFELDDFFVQYSALGPISNNATPSPSAQSEAANYDVHIGILPRILVRNVLEICKFAGIEPNVLTVPSSAIGAAYQIAKDFFKENSAVVFNRGDEYALAVYINGEVRVERSLYASQLLSANPAEKREDSFQHIFTAIKLLLASAERRYQTRIEKVYLLGREVKAANSHQIFGRPLEGLPFKDILKTNDSQVGLAPLSTVFAFDDAAKAPLSNFRSREFSFTPKLGEFFRALLGTRRHITRALGALALTLVVIYAAREYAVHSAESVLIRQIQRVIPGFSSESDKIRDNLLKAENKLGEELATFGSRAKISPADAFIDLLKTLPDSGEMSITGVRVSDTRVQVTGETSEIAVFERITNKLRDRKDVFQKVTSSNRRSTNGRFNVTLDIILAQ